MTVHLALPRPMSLNAIYANAPGKGRVKTKEYKAWVKEAAQVLMLQRPPSFTTPVTITYYVGESGWGNADAGNLEKCLTDALVNARVIPDDNRKHLRATAVFWIPNMVGAVAQIDTAASLNMPTAFDLVRLADCPDPTVVCAVEGKVA